MKPFMKPLRLLASLALGATILTGPTRVVAEQPTSGIVSATDQQGPQTAKHLRLGIWNTAGNVTTYTIGNSWNDWMLWLQFDKLVEPSPYVGQAENWLATKVEQVSDDARVWEITLRDGIKWHDGTDFTAEDVAFTFEYYREGPPNRWTHHASSIPRMEGIEILDRLKVRLTAQKPMPNFDRITAADLPMIQKAQWENVEKPRQFTDIGIGTGPYILLDYKADEYYHFKANENYWQGKPLVDELTLIMIKDPQTMFTALRTGEIDGAARSLPPELVNQWKTDPKIELVKAPSLWGVWLSMNYARETFDNRDLRHAVSLAVNPEPMLERVMLGMGQTGSGWFHPDSFWTSPNAKNTYDKAAAMAAFDAMGYKDIDGDGFRETADGKPLDWSVVVSTNRPLQVRASEMIVAQLAEIGIKSHLKALDVASLKALYKSGDYDLRVSDITPHGIADQDMMMIFYRGNLKRSPTLDEEKADIAARWLDASTRDERAKLGYELQDYYNKYPNQIMLWYPDGIFAYNWESYDNYVSSAGYGIFHKYSFLPNESRKGTSEAIGEKIDY